MIKQTIYFIGVMQQERITRFLSEHKSLFVNHNYEYLPEHPTVDGKFELTFASEEQKEMFEELYRYNYAYLKPGGNNV